MNSTNNFNKKYYEQKSILDNFISGHFYTYYFDDIRQSGYYDHNQNVGNILVSMISNNISYKRIFDTMSSFDSANISRFADFIFLIITPKADTILEIIQQIRDIKSNIVQSINPLEYNINDSDITNIINWSKEQDIDFKLYVADVIKNRSRSEKQIRIIQFPKKEDFITVKLKFL